MIYWNRNFPTSIDLSNFSYSFRISADLSNLTKFSFSTFSNLLFQLHPSLRNNFELVIYFVLEHLIFSLNCGFKSTYGITSRRLKLHMESRGSLWDKILVNFGKNLLSIFVKTTKNFQIYHYRLIQFYKTGSIISKLPVPKFANGSPHPRLPADRSGLIGTFRSAWAIHGLNSSSSILSLS